MKSYSAKRPDLCRADILDTLIIVAREKTLILTFVLLGTVIGAIASLTIPTQFTATAVIVPPRYRQSNLNLLGIQALPMAGLQDWSQDNPSDIFVRLLASHSVENILIDRFRLREAYRQTYYQEAQKQLERHSEILVSKEGLIYISVNDRDRERAAGLANAYVDELRRVVQGFSSASAQQRRMTYETQLTRDIDQLSIATNKLQAVQENFRLWAPHIQETTLISSIAQLRSQIAESEVQLRVLRLSDTAENPDLERTEVALRALQGKLENLKRAASLHATESDGVTLDLLPQSELEFRQWSRQVKLLENSTEFLSKEIEAARLDEGDTAVMLSVIDQAVTPEWNLSLKAAVVAAVAGLTAFFAAVLWVFILESIRLYELNSENRIRMMELQRSFRFRSDVARPTS